MNLFKRVRGTECLIAVTANNFCQSSCWQNPARNVKIWCSTCLHRSKRSLPEMSHLMFCKARGTFTNPSKGECKSKKDVSKDFQHGQRTDEGLAAIQFGPLFTVSTVVIQNIARVRNCPDITILNSLFVLCLFVLLSFCLFVFLSFDLFVFSSFLSSCLFVRHHSDHMS